LNVLRQCILGTVPITQTVSKDKLGANRLFLPAQNLPSLARTAKPA